MMYSNCCSQVSLIKNYATVQSCNASPQTASCSIVRIEPVCLILTQYATKRKLNLGDSLVYSIYVINNLKNDIYGIRLKDSLPRGVNFVDTQVENGRYRQSENKIFYEIESIKAYSYSKITISVYPVTLGKKVNSIEVTCKKAACTVNNPCKVCSAVN